MTSPWLAINSTTIDDTDHDPWATSSRPSLINRKSSSSYLSPEPSTSKIVDRHPLRSPSPNVLVQRRNTSSSSPDPTVRSPVGVATEWKAISAGLAGLFSSGDPSRYQWPADPVQGSVRRREKARNSADLSGDQDGGETKGHETTFAGSTLDKLEGWFGLKQDKVAASSSAAPPRRGASVEDTMVRVLIHPVAPSDTLSSLALHYGADIQTLRRSNKLWPGDAAQMRKAIYIPIDSCKYRPPNAEIKVLPSSGGAISAPEQDLSLNLAFVPKEKEEEEPGTLQQVEPALPIPAEDPVSDFMPDTNKSYADDAALSRTGSVSRSGGGYPSSLAPSRRAGSVGGSSNPSVSAASSGFVLPRGPIHVSKVSKEKLNFFAPSEKKDKASIGVGPGHPDYRPGESGLDDLLIPQAEAGASRPWLSRNISEADLSAEDDIWKPNVWKFGKSRAAPNDLQPPPRTSDRSYNGWNDAPPTTAIVAKAYDNGAAYKKRQQQNHHRLLHDLAAGLPANTGAASKWARPINFGDSLPPNATRRVGSGGGAGFGKLLNDTIRGRIPLEGAFEAALGEVRAATALDLPHHEGARRAVAMENTELDPLGGAATVRASEGKKVSPQKVMSSTMNLPSRQRSNMRDFGAEMYNE